MIRSDDWHRAVAALVARVDVLPEPHRSRLIASRVWRELAKQSGDARRLTTSPVAPNGFVSCPAPATAAPESVPGVAVGAFTPNSPSSPPSSPPKPETPR